MQAETHYLHFLRQELQARRARNPRYSLRGFARALGIGGSALSEILSGKRVPSPKLLDRLADRLDLLPEVRERFRISAAMEQSKRGLKRISPVYRMAAAQQALRSGGVSLVVDPELAPEAKRRIESFAVELMGYLEFHAGGRAYQLQIGLFPQAEPVAKR
jgi:transcriptional regulator with XRE-family HTH domain